MNPPIDFTKLAVRISVKDSPVGTGVLLNPSTDSQWVYLVTAKHCLKDCESLDLLSIDFFNGSSDGFKSITFTNDCKRIDHEERDLSCLIIPTSFLPYPIPIISISSNIRQGVTCYFYGFPKAVDSNEIESIEGITSISIHEIFKISTSQSFSAEPSVASEENVKGFSGSGIFVQKDDRILLIGIVSKYLQNLNRFEAIDFSFLDKLLGGNIFSTNNNHLEINQSQYSSNTNLIPYFQGQLNDAEVAYNSFYPFKANEILKQLSKKLDETFLNPAEKNPLLSKLYYLKALCLLEDENNAYTESGKLFIKAYNLQPNLQYHERAIQAYYRLGETPKAIALAEELISTDPYNARAYAFLHHIEPNYTIPNIVKIDPIYKVISIAYEDKTDKMIEMSLFDKFFQTELEESKLPEGKTINRIELTYWFYVAQYALSSFLTKNGLHLSNRKKYEPQSILELKYAYSLYEIICKRVHDTQIEKQVSFQLAFFDYWYCKHILENTTESVDEMYKLFFGNEQSKNNPFIITKEGIYTNIPQKIYLLSDALLRVKYYEKLIKSLKKIKEYKPNDLFIFESQAYKGLQDVKNAALSIKEYIKGVEEISEINAVNFIYAIGILGFSGESPSDIWDFISKGKLFKSTIIANLLEALCLHGDKNNQERVSDLCKTIEKSKVLSSIYNLPLAICYFGIRDFKSTIRILKNSISFTEESEELILYIRCLYFLRQETSHLLELLEYWRHNFAPDLMLLDIEVQIRNQLRDYVSLEEIARYGLVHFPENYIFLYLLIESLDSQNHTNKTTELKSVLNELEFEIISSFEWKEQFKIGRICINNDLIDKGKEIYYRALKANSQNSMVKQVYFSNFLNLEKETKTTKLKVVEKGSIVQLRDDSKGETTFLELTIDELSNNKLAQLLIGKKKGEIALYKRTSGNDITYTIIEIYDKYIGQQVLFYRDIDNRPAAYSDIERIQGDNAEDIDSLLKKMQEVHGPEGTKRQIITESVIKQFAECQIGFIEFSCIFGNNYFDTWKYITSDYNDGFPIIPLVLQNKYVKENAEIVIDFSTLFTLSKISKSLDLDVRLNKRPFVVSQRMIDWIEEELRNLNFEKKSSMRMHITSDSVKPIFFPDNFFKLKSEELREILNWTRKNTIVEIVPEIFEAVREGDQKYDLHTLMILETIFQSSKSNRMLLTNDFLHNKLKSINLISIENYFTKINITAYETLILPQLLILNYRGLTLTNSSLWSLYEENKIKMSRKNTLFHKSLHGLSPFYNPNQRNIFIVIDFLKNIYAESSDLWFKQSTSRRLLECALNGAQGLINIDFLKQKLRATFSLLGKHREDILEDLDYVLNIIGWEE